MSLTNEDLQAIANLFDSKMDQKLQPINNRLDNMDNRLDKLESEVSGMKNGLDKLESEVSGLKIGQTAIRKELKEVHHKVTDTYDLALEAWGQSTENRTWLETLPK